MYGLVNQAIRGFICQQYGQVQWSRIVEEADVAEEGFVCSLNHDDQITYRLFTIAASELNLSEDCLIESVGKFWTTHLVAEQFGPLMGLTGESLIDFLHNLDNLHARLGMAFPELNPPSFHIEPVADDQVKLHYRSNRRGLTPLARGLLQGFAEHFGVALRMTEDQSAANTTTFAIQILHDPTGTRTAPRSASPWKTADAKDEQTIDFATWVLSQGIDL
jgi:hypothetical protein